MNKRVLIFAIVFILFLVVIFYVYIGIGFGRGVSNFGKDIHKINKDWRENNEMPLDTIETDIKEIIDSISSNGNVP